MFEALDRTPVKNIALVSTEHNAALTIMNTFEALGNARKLHVVYKTDRKIDRP